MSADVLRQAATLMRERAAAAAPGPWSIDPSIDETEVIDRRGTILADAFGAAFENAAHIASWHPGVALAVAAGLARAAERWDDSLAAQLGPWNMRDYPWLVIATDYLGRSA